jgi:hypothetical protein
MAAVTPLEEAQFAAFEEEFGGRDRLAAFLNAADLPGRESLLPGMLVDPANDRLSLAKICAWARIPLFRLYAMLKDASLVKGQVKALVRVGDRLPDVAGAVMEDAIPGQRVCQSCGGLRTYVEEPTTENPNPAPRLCQACRGTGTVYYTPEIELRKVALQMGKLLDRPGGVTNTNVNVQKFGAGATGTVVPFDQVVLEADRILYGTGRERRYGFRPDPAADDVADDASTSDGAEDADT